MWATAAMDVDTAVPGSQPVADVFATDELVGVFLTCLRQVKDRLSLGASCRALRTMVAQPVHWRAVQFLLDRAPGSDLTSLLRSTSLLRMALRSLQPNALESLQLLSRCPLLDKARLLDSGPALLDRTSLTFPQLIELDISLCAVDADMLHEAFSACGGTLLRLDLSGVRILVQTGEDQFDEASVRIQTSYLMARPHLLEPLTKLAVLVARNTDPTLGPNHAQTPESFSILCMAHEACPALETLMLGYDSEFQENPEGGPEAETEFNQPVWCVVDGTRLTPRSAPTARLQHLSLRGYVALLPTALQKLLSGAPPIHTLDLNGCQCLGADRDSSGLLPSAYACLAPTLTNLNVRGTAFDDACARALASAGARLVRLNASCTLLSGGGLLAIAIASPQLRVLDLCYARHCARDVTEVVVAVARHTPGVEMLGLGGFEQMSLAQLRVMLDGNQSSMRHVGIGGCTMNGAAALRLVAEHCPSLTALNAHKLVEPTVSALRELLAHAPALTSLDVHGCIWDHPEDTLDLAAALASGDQPVEAPPAAVPLGCGEETVRQWMRLGRARVGEHFVEATVVQLGDRAAEWRLQERTWTHATAVGRDEAARR